MIGRRESLRELICRESESTRELMSNQHEEHVNRHQEYMRDQDRREKESKREFRRRDEEFREFMREIVLRNEKIYGPIIVEMEEASEQIKANTEAVLSMLDRLDSK